LYTSCVLGLRLSALFNEFLLIKKKKKNLRLGFVESKGFLPYCEAIVRGF